MVHGILVHQHYVELDSLSNVSRLHDSIHPFGGDRFGHGLGDINLAATWRHRIVHLGRFFKNHAAPNHPFPQKGKTCFGKHLFLGSSSPRECYR